jgi:hypothetical protein
MSSHKLQGEELENDITFITTPAAVPSKLGTDQNCGAEITNVSTIKLLYDVPLYQLTLSSMKLTAIAVPHYT